MTEKRPTMTALNSMKSGARLSRLSTGRLPRKLHRVQRYVADYKRKLEAIVMEIKSEISLTDAHAIDAAVKFEQHSKICMWLLRQRLDEMTTADVRACSEAIAQAATKRNAAMKELQLSAAQKNVLDALWVEDAA